MKSIKNLALAVLLGGSLFVTGCDTGVREGSVGLFREQPSKDVQQQVFAVGLLHVENQSARRRCRQIHDRP